jgi:aspartyl/asparaginyl beta-hydroxylase (cupin superfamily)
MGTDAGIKAHRGPSNIRLRCHFPLTVPPGCGMRVGEEETVWREGHPLFFDDSYDHEVWARVWACLPACMWLGVSACACGRE